MADVDQTPVSSPDTVPAYQDPAFHTCGDHEASDVVDQDTNADNVQPQPTLDEIVENVVGDTHEASLQNAPPSTTDVSKKADAHSKSASPASKSKATTLAKSASGKLNSPALADKKATLGPANVKPAPPGKTTATSPSSPLSKTATASPSTAKKTTATSSANPTKTATMSSSRVSGSGPAPPSRRSSMLPPRAPSATGVPPAPKSRTSTLLASLASSKPPPTEVNATPRPSVVSPVGSVGSIKSNATGNAAVPPRPRASVSDALKRTPSSSKQTLPPTAVPPSQARAMWPMGSISSIREVRDDPKAQENLQEKLKEANESISIKSEAIATLEAKVLQLEASLGEAVVDVRAKASFIDQLQSSKQSADANINNLKSRLQQVQAEHTRNLAKLESIREELRNTEESKAAEAENVKTLEALVETLRADIVAAQDNFESLRASSDQSSAAAAGAAQMEREAFLRAKADVETVTAEMNSLKVAHDKAIRDAATRSHESQQRAVDVAALTSQVIELKAEREENAAKISELEVEILELRESQENAEDEHKRTLDHLQKVEAELIDAVAATQQILRDVEARDAENAQKVADTALLHSNAVDLIKSDLAKATSEIDTLRNELAAAHVAHDEVRAAADESAEAHEREMEETEQSYLSKHIELSEEIKRLSAELEAQETKYSAKVDAVKAEHDQLLKEAFERAKNEAGEAHGQDLHGLRAESRATIEQLQVAHQSTLNSLQEEHAAALESQVNAAEKSLNSQLLELRATQDDLSKAKFSLDTSRAENESLRAQLEDARANFIAASANADQAAEIDRLTQDITSLRDENAMLNDVLAATKESLSEISTNHSKELEEAARIRVEEVMRLRSIHDGELSTLAAQKSELTLSLSDLEGEIATLRAQLAAVEPAAIPRSNGVFHASATAVTRDELQKVHEAHNLKMHDLQAEHDRVIRAQRVEVETLQARLDEVQQDVARKSMEIQYLEQEQEESQDSITRLKADLEALKSSTS